MAQLQSPTVSPVIDSDSLSSFTHQEDASNRPKPSAPPVQAAVAGKEKAPKPAEEPSKPKRGRGRPRKNPDAPPKPPQDPNTQKRGRGRPRKNPLPQQAAGSEPAKPAAPAAGGGGETEKPAGAPKKNPATATSTAEAKKPPVEAPAVKRKRGRPRKRPLPTESAATGGEENATAVDKETAAVDDSGNSAPATQTSESPAKRKRGRPRKNPVDPAAATATVTTTVAIAEATDGGQAEVPKRKRGRPRKNPPADSNGQSPAKQAKVQPAAATEGQAAATGGQSAPTKRKRGRPKKVERPPAPAQPAEGGKLVKEKQGEGEPTPEFHLVTFDESSSDGEVGENIASLVSRNGVLQDKEQEAGQARGKEQGVESSDSSYTTPDP